MVCYTTSGGAEEVLDGAHGSFIVLVLVVRCHTVRGRKSDSMSSIRVATRDQPVDGADDALIHVCAAFEIGFMWISGGMALMGNPEW